jgi:chorismate mutase
MAAEPSVWEIAAAVGQVVAAVSSVAGLFFVGVQIRSARKVADIKTLQEFNRGTQERELALLNAQDNIRKEQAFVELLNFLEVNAAALNGNSFPPISRRIVKDSLATSIAAIQIEPAWAGKFSDAIRTISTFEELGLFMRREKKSIQAIIQMMKERQAETVGATS